MSIPRVATASMAVSVAIGPLFAQGEGNAHLAPDELPQHLVKILRTSNKAQTNRYIPKVYDFVNVNPYAVIRQVRRVMEIEEGAWFAFANQGPDGQMDSGKLLVVFPDYQEPYIDELMRLLDVPGLTSSSGTKRGLIALKHRDASDPGFLDTVALEGTPTADLVPDVQTNNLFIQDAPSGVSRLLDKAIEHDVPTPQLEVVVTVYEIDLTDDGQIGLDYVSWKNGPGRNLGAVGLFAEKEKITTLGGTSGTSSNLLYNSGKGTAGLPARQLESTGRNAAYLYEVPSAYFDFLVAKGCAQVMTRSKLVALNRSTALLEVGDEILYYQEKHLPDLRGGVRLQPLDPLGDLNAVVDTSEDDEITDTLGVFVADHPDNRVVVPTLADRSLGAASTGFFLQITPTINAFDARLDVFLSVVQLTGFADDGTPVLASRVVDTRLHIPHDSREISLGGLTRKRRVDGANKIPWLGDIPVLGVLFGGTSYLDQKTLVVTTMRTRVVEFGDSNATPEDEGTKRAVDTGIIATKENEPGFIRN